jgi:NAD(P)-dependent dehydrogenase (short-subunit alcohol dehydrogenase family)
MKGKVVLLTGGNSGLGRATALSLAKMGAALTIVCRDQARGDSARREIAKESGNSSVSLIVADLLLLREVRRTASEFRESNPRLDVLINNAGSNFPDYAETEDGLERTMVLNYFAPFLLTDLLLDMLEESEPSRIVNVSSAAHYGARLDLDIINGGGDMGIGGLGAYGRSKLALVLFTYELARRLQGGGVTANCLHPGAVRTHIWAHAGAFSPLSRLASQFMMSPEDGAKTQIYLASSAQVEGVTGKYFEKSKPKRSSESSYDEALARRLWDVSMKTTRLQSG